MPQQGKTFYSLFYYRKLLQQVKCDKEIPLTPKIILLIIQKVMDLFLGTKLFVCKCSRFLHVNQGNKIKLRRTADQSLKWQNYFQILPTTYEAWALFMDLNKHISTLFKSEWQASQSL